MDLKYLNTFRTIVEEGSFSRAAERLNYTQSTITFQMGQLEGELSAQLFEKVGRRMVLSQAGRRLLPYVDQVLDAVDGRTVLVSMMAVNNEVGSILPVGQVCRQLRKAYPRLLIHCDAVQAFGKEPLKVGKALDVDFLTVSGHKIYAPKGCGALYIKKGSRFRPVSFGGGQEKNVRPGTEPIANLCAMGLSASLLMAEREENHKRVTEIRGALLEGLTKLPDICINSPADSTPYILNFSALGVRSEIMLHFLEEKGIYVSSGSACAKGEPSHVLLAMDLARERADSAIRLSFGRYNTLDEVPVFLEAVSEALKRFRR